MPGLDSQQANDLIAAGRDRPGRADAAGRRHARRRCDDVLRLGPGARRRSPRSSRRCRAAPRAVDHDPAGALAAGPTATASSGVVVCGRTGRARARAVPAARRARRRRTSPPSRPRSPRRTPPALAAAGRDGRRPLLRLRRRRVQPRRARRAARGGGDPVRGLRLGHRHRAPARHGRVRPRGGRQLDVAARRVIDVPSWAPVLGAMVGLGVGIDYALFVVTRHRDYLADGESVPRRRPRARHGRTAGGVRRRHRRRLRPRARRGGCAVHDRRRHRARARGRGDGARVGHAAAGAARPVRARHRPLRARVAAPARRRAVVALGHARHPLRLGLRRRCRGPAARPGRTGAGAARRHPRRRRAPARAAPSGRPTTCSPKGSAPDATGPLSSPSTPPATRSVPRPLGALRSTTRASPRWRRRRALRRRGSSTLVAFPTDAARRTRPPARRVERLRAPALPRCARRQPGAGLRRWADGELRRRRGPGQRPAARGSSAPCSPCRSCC